MTGDRDPNSDDVDQPFRAAISDELAAMVLEEFRDALRRRSAWATRSPLMVVADLSVRGHDNGALVGVDELISLMGAVLDGLDQDNPAVQHARGALWGFAKVREVQHRQRLDELREKLETIRRDTPQPSQDSKDRLDPAEYDRILEDIARTQRDAQMTLEFIQRGYR